MTKTTRCHGVGEVARLSGTTVRALHHYESIGLLVPSARSAAGYRQYDAGDLDRLTRILYYRHLGFSLDDIATLLADPADLVEHLRRQHRMLTEQLQHVRGMVQAIEKEMEAHMSGQDLTPEEKLEIFGTEYDPSWEDEAREKWEGTSAWQQSRERTAHLTADDWRRLKTDTDAFNQRLVDAFAAGVTPGSADADALADAHLASLQSFYDADRAMQRTLADTFVEDARFRSTYDALAPGLAEWWRDVIHVAPGTGGAA
ncbi:MerR family transcriptional regulator [Aeromicrobium sp. NPDC092404]|uniref:MerR family transcriptional regulator n=1 Tax=Aeromicrobium sp. NPDC092404 TaxID=3154976 RepID=UPI0034205ED9